MNIRTLLITDATAVAELWVAGAEESAAADSAFQPKVSVAQYSTTVEEEIRSGTIVGWGAFDEVDCLQGYLTACVAQTSPEFEQTSYLYLLDLDVSASARRRPVGSQLVQRARQYASEQRLLSIEVSWLSADSRATSFWQVQGFTPYLARGRGSA